MHELSAELFNGDAPKIGRFLFRGMADADWSLVSAFDRTFGELERKARSSAFDRLMESFQSECWKQNVDGPPDADIEGWQALGQHYGLPTRLLDWSESPYIASYFAFNSSLVGQWDGKFHRVAVWALDSESDLWAGDAGVSILDRSNASNDRIRRQLGRFTYARTPTTSLDDFVCLAESRGQHHGAALWQFTIPSTEVAVALSELGLMNITSASLFPDVDGACKSALTRVLLEQTIRE